MGVDTAAERKSGRVRERGEVSGEDKQLVGLNIHDPCLFTAGYFSLYYFPLDFTSREVCCWLAVGL